MKKILLFWIFAGIAAHAMDDAECRKKVIAKIARLKRELAVLEEQRRVWEAKPGEFDPEQAPKRGKKENEITFAPTFLPDLKEKMSKRTAPTQHDLSYSMGYTSNTKVAHLMSGAENFLDKDRYVLLCHTLKISAEDAVGFLDEPSKEKFGDYIREKLKGRYVPR